MDIDCDLQLTSDENRIVAELLASLSQRDKLSLSLEYLLQQWRYLVENIEQGYEDTIFDYTNSLGKRDFLEALLNESPQTLRDKLSKILQPWDSRFREATKDVGEAVLPTSDETAVLGYWWYRVPTNLSNPPYDFQHWASYYTNIGES